MILAIHEKHSCIDERRAVKLTTKQAMRLARILGGIASRFHGREDDTLDDLP